jgi:hypothetical protein
MSFVGPPYTHDIFISYNHGDVRGEGASNFMRWSRCLWEALRGEFASHDDLAGLDIFFDQSPDPASGVDPFVSLDKQLDQKVKASAVFMPLVSPRYLKSKWCQDELSWWLAGQKDAGLDSSGRLAPLLVWGIPPEGSESWPKAIEATPLKQLIGIYFFDRANAAMRPQPFGWPASDGKIADKQFDNALLDAVGYIRLHLLDFKKRLAERAPAAKSADGAKPSIYLHGRADAAQPWDKAFRALSDAGFPVTPDAPEPIEPDTEKRNAIRETRVKGMSRCDALVLLAPDDSTLLTDELSVIGKHDRGLAIKRAEDDLQQTGKRLPAAVVDPVGDAARAERRRMQVKNSGLEWFDFNAPAWVSDTASWLGQAA